MALREEMEQQGIWLFKWRSYLPLLGLPLFILALRDFGAFERRWGAQVSGIWECFSVAVSFIGLGIRAMVAGYVPRGTSGRNTQTQAASTLNTTGMYSICRNPLYLGNFVIMVGITLFLQVWWLALIVWVGFWLYYERIIFAEEAFLRVKFGDTFLTWAAKTPIIIPRFKNWQKPSLEFSMKTMLRREFTTYMATVAPIFFLKLLGSSLQEGRLYVHKAWIIFFAISVVIYNVFLFLKKKTHVLDVSGR
jgi:protein-S-isoprenylcysteine O-methyltransferase Ste14